MVVSHEEDGSRNEIDASFYVISSYTWDVVTRFLVPQWHQAGRK